MQVKDLILVMPVYNIQDNINVEEMLDSWRQILLDLNLNFEIKTYPHYSQTMSQGEILLNAYKENIDKADWIMEVDGDNEMDAIHFKRFWELRESYDLICGRRFYFERQFSRELVSFLAFCWVRLLFGKGLRDVNGPYRLFRASSFREFFSNFKDKNRIQTPHLIMSAYALQRKLRIKELWVPFNTMDEEDQAKIPTGRIIKSSFKAVKESASFYWGNI